MIRQTLIILTLSVIAFTCSGCATILGGIIGYQSGEACIGMAIGAAVDLSGDIARGVGQMAASEKTMQNDFTKKSTFDADKGEITIPITPFNRERTEQLTNQLQQKFQQNNWSCQPTKKSVKQPWFRPSRWNETWQCTTAQADSPQSFDLKIDFRSNRDTKIRIIPAETEQAAAITSQIYEWLEQSVSQVSS